MTGIEANAVVCASSCAAAIMLHASQTSADLEYSHIHEYTLMLSLTGPVRDCGVYS